MEEKKPSTAPEFRPGDTIKVSYKIIEEGKERIQPFEGVVIAEKGAGISRTITVRKIASLRMGVERIFPIHSPNITKIEVVRKGKVRRAKLNYLKSDPSLRVATLKDTSHPRG